MKVGFLGSGTWGFALANLISNNGHRVILWGRSKETIEILKNSKKHPKLADVTASQTLKFTNDIFEAIHGADVIFESVTTKGIRPVFSKITAELKADTPIIITSKGIEQETQLLIPEILKELFVKSTLSNIGVLGGPSHAEEVVKCFPTSVVSAAVESATLDIMQQALQSAFFRVYPNKDILGVAFGGAMKNIIAIACGISDGLGFGDNTKAALMTRGLHEIHKLSASKECSTRTLYGLSGMGDLCVTCLSKLSRNYKFGFFLAKKLGAKEALAKVGMAVEGMYTAVSAQALGKTYGINAPITNIVFDIIYNGLCPENAVQMLLDREIKEEHL